MMACRIIGTSGQLIMYTQKPAMENPPRFIGVGLLGIPIAIYTLQKWYRKLQPGLSFRESLLRGYASCGRRDGLLRPMERPGPERAGRVGGGLVVGLTAMTASTSGELWTSMVPEISSAAGSTYIGGFFMQTFFWSLSASTHSISM